MRRGHGIINFKHLLVDLIECVSGMHLWRVTENVTSVCICKVRDTSSQSRHKTDNPPRHRLCYMTRLGLARTHKAWRTLKLVAQKLVSSRKVLREGCGSGGEARVRKTDAGWASEPHQTPGSTWDVYAGCNCKELHCFVSLSPPQVMNDKFIRGNTTFLGCVSEISSDLGCL